MGSSSEPLSAQGAPTDAAAAQQQQQEQEQHQLEQQQQYPDGCPLVRPQNDTWSYRILHLGNGLKVVLVTDSEADKAAASIDVNVGSLSDPDEFPGLAHFCEHMLFYASAKYPKEDEYSKFISDHGGSTNAWTASENTNYQFDINWQHLELALDRFAQFFTAPLISQDGVEREVNAVDSEHGKNLASDPWRQMQLYKHTANPQHPWARFATGSRRTLLEGPRDKGLDPRQAVADFHSNHYSPNLMALAVTSRHSLDELEAMVRPRFEGLLDKGLKVKDMPTDVFLEEHKRQLIKLVPVKDTHSLELCWQCPPSWKEYKAAPLNFLSHLLGHEGEGSAFALLKALGWATSLVAGESSLSISSVSFFYVKVELTKEGQAHAQEVGAILFKYIRLITACKEQWPQIYEEARGLSLLRFNFRDKPRPYSYATSLSSALQLYPDTDLLTATYHVMQEFRPELVQQSLDCLSLDGVRVCWTSREFEGHTDSSEPWYGTKYSLTPLPEEWLQLWGEPSPDSRLHLPRPNPFIPSDFSLREGEAWQGPPRLLVHEEGAIRLHHKCDVQFKMPKADVLLEFQSPEGYCTPESTVCCRLFTLLIEDELNELSYDAELAGLRYSVYNTQAGFVVMVSGYSHKLGVLLREVLGRVAGFSVRPERLQLVREKAVKGWKNMAFQQPYQWAMYRRELVLNLRRWKVEEYLHVAPGISEQQLQQWHQRMMARVHVEGLAVGNISADEATLMASELKALLQDKLGSQPLFPSQMRDLRCVRLPVGSSLLAERGPNADNDNSAVVVTYQVGPDDARRNALLQLLVHLCKRDAFHVLRTQQQLGYIVSLHSAQEQQVHSLEFIVQSNAFGAAHLAQRVEAFVQDALSTLLPAKCAPEPSPRAADETAAAIQGKEEEEEEEEEEERVAEERQVEAAEEAVQKTEEAVPGVPAQDTTASTPPSTGPSPTGSSPAPPATPGGVPVAPPAAAPASGPSPVASVAPAAAPAPGPGGASGTPAAAAPPAPPAPGPSEFSKAVDELAKTKLQPPKTLGELSARLWNEVYYGTLMFDRQEREVEELRKLSPDELRAFAQEVMGSTPVGASAAPATSSSAQSGTEAVTLSVTPVLEGGGAAPAASSSAPSGTGEESETLEGGGGAVAPQPAAAGSVGVTRRKLVVAIVGGAEVKAAAAGQEAGGKVAAQGSAGEQGGEAGCAATGGGEAAEGAEGRCMAALRAALAGEGAREVGEIAAFKRSCEVHPNVAALHRARSSCLTPAA